MRQLINAWNKYEERYKGELSDELVQQYSLCNCKLKIAKLAQLRVEKRRFDEKWCIAAVNTIITILPIIIGTIGIAMTIESISNERT